MIPNDPSIDGVVLFAQVLEVDAVASHGLSFSNALRTTLGTLTCDPDCKHGRSAAIPR
jgi:hypothetical protein